MSQSGIENFKRFVPKNSKYEVAFDFIGEGGQRLTQKSHIVRTASEKFEVFVQDVVLQRVKQRLEAGELGNLAGVSKKYVDEALAASETSRREEGGVWLTSARAVTLLNATKSESNSASIRSNALLSFRLKCADGEYRLAKDLDGLIPPPTWPKQARFAVGKRVAGKVYQAAVDSPVSVRRSGSGGASEVNIPGPETTLDGLIELFLRMSVADIEVTHVDATPESGPAARLPVGGVLPRAEVHQISAFVAGLMSSLPKFAPSVDSPFEITTSSMAFERVLEALNAGRIVPATVWSRFATFANDNGWTSYLPDRACCNVILEGVPGTGKTHSLKLLTAEIGSGETMAAGRFATVMHPATSYEDFVEGLRPGNPAARVGAQELSDTELRSAVMLASGQNRGTEEPSNWFFDSSAANAGGFAIHDGFFVAACAEAVRNPSTPYVVLLDELNRCNIPKVMGDLITTMEVSKRARWDALNKQWHLLSSQVVTLPYSKRQFFVPDNLSIVGTMNTTDRSVAPMDAALRRRFVFVRLEPEFGPFEGQVDFEIALNVVSELNIALSNYLGNDAILGHSYFYDMSREIVAGAEVTDVTRFYFDKVIFPMVVDTLVNNGCLAELAEANRTKVDVASKRSVSPAESFLQVLKSIAGVAFSGRGITQTLKLTLL